MHFTVHISLRLVALEEGKVSYCSNLSHGVVCAVILQPCGKWKEKLCGDSWRFIESCESVPSNDVLSFFPSQSCASLADNASVIGG